MKRLRLLGLLLLTSGAVILWGGCTYEEHRPYAYEPGPYGPNYYAWYYYPDAEVYYEPNRQVYWWRDRDEWRSGPRAPGGIELRSHVRVDIHEREPWRHHEEIRREYPRHERREERQEERQEMR